MPTYAITTMKSLTQSQREKLVASVTAIHAEEATAPRYFVQVVFYDAGP
jgi:phenylpyruvate tautomerase PptA (4-oxalocrotonate tautomerase family)